MVEKFTAWDLIKDYIWVIVGIIMIVLAYLVWNEEEPGFSIVFGIFGFILIMRNLGN